MNKYFVDEDGSNNQFVVAYRVIERDKGIVQHIQEDGFLTKEEAQNRAVALNEERSKIRQVAKQFIQNFVHRTSNEAISNEEFASESKQFQNTVIQSIEAQGYIVKKVESLTEGLRLQLFLDHSA